MVSIDSFVTCAGAPPGFRVRGPAAGGAPPAPWWQPIADILTAGGAQGHLWLHDEGVSAAIGAPVDVWEAVNSGAVWEQPGASSLCPLRQSDGHAYDGTDDRQNAGPGLAAMLAGGTPWTVGVGWARSTTNPRLLWAITNNKTTARIQAITASQQLAFVPTATLFTSVAPDSPGSNWFTRDGVAYTRRAGGADTTATTAVYPTDLDTLTLGARRTPAASVFFSGRISWVALSTRALSNTDLNNIAGLLAANGYPT